MSMSNSTKRRLARARARKWAKIAQFAAVAFAALAFAALLGGSLAVHTHAVQQAVLY